MSKQPPLLSVAATPCGDASSDDDKDDIHDDEETHSEVEEDENDNDNGEKTLADYTRGIDKDKYVLDQWQIPDPDGFVDFESMLIAKKQQDILKRINDMTPTDVTLPVALVLLDPDNTYDTLSKARRAIRKGNILLQRKATRSIIHDIESLVVSEETTIDKKTRTTHQFDSKKSKKGKVGDRVYPGDIIVRQIRITGSFYPSCTSSNPPPFDLPVVYEDDHLAVVNKPEGYPVFNHHKGGHHGIMTVKSTVPYVLKPPTVGTHGDCLRRPRPVHRIDKATSGLLLIAKTKLSSNSLRHQFANRQIRKTYTAILNGQPSINPNPNKSTTPTTSCFSSNDNNDDDDDDDDRGGDNADPSLCTTTTKEWNVIDTNLEEQSAITHWRTLKTIENMTNMKTATTTDDCDDDDTSSKNNDDNDVFTLVEVQPKTGRYHQIRRHMAWQLKCPLVGDKRYDNGTAKDVKLRKHGLFLCSNKVCFQHPYYNTTKGKNELLMTMPAASSTSTTTTTATQSNYGDDHNNISSSVGSSTNSNSNALQLVNVGKSSKDDNENIIVMVSLEIDLPTKFNDLI